MKRIMILSVLFFFGQICFSQSEAEEKAAITTAVGYYLDGGTNNDFETLKKAFHDTATMKYIRDGKYVEVNAIEFFGGVMKPGPAQDRKTKVLYVDYTGNAAQAKLEIEYPTFYFYDYMNLVKIDGEWKVVSKIFHRVQK